MPEIITEVTTPRGFYIRSDGAGGTEIIVVLEDENRIYRISDLQLFNLACDATLLMSKKTLAMYAALK
jgi:hypothetical protein